MTLEQKQPNLISKWEAANRAKTWKSRCLPNRYLTMTPTLLFDGTYPLWYVPIAIKGHGQFGSVIVDGLTGVVYSFRRIHYKGAV